MIDLSKLTKGRQNKPPRLVVYGPHGIGKSTFANDSGAVFIPTEDGLGTIDLVAGSFPVARSLDDVWSALKALDGSGMPAVAIDTLDWLERLIHEDVMRSCPKRASSMMEAHGGYGKAYLIAMDIWHKVFRALDNLREQGAAIILLAHTRIVEYQNPMGENFDRYQLDLHSSKSISVPTRIMEWADAVLFATYRINTRALGSDEEKRKGDVEHVGIGSGERVLYTEERPAFQAKNRYSLNPELPFSWTALMAAMKGSN